MARGPNSSTRGTEDPADQNEAVKLILSMDPPADSPEADQLVEQYKQQSGGIVPSHNPISAIFGPNHPETSEECSVPFRKLKRQYESRDGLAVTRFHQVLRDFDKWHLGKLNPNLLNLKRNADHHALFEMGLTLGLDKLTGEELAYCFDDVCPCALTKRGHSSEALKKLRARIAQQLRDNSTPD
jgi:hypothetical protein